MLSLSQPHIQGHHQGEADGEEEGAEVGVAALGHFGDEFFDDDVEHGSCGEAGQGALQRFAQSFFQKEYAGCSQRGTQKRY